MKIYALTGSLRVEIPPALIAFLRSKIALFGDTLTQVGEDIWITDGFVNVHTDATAHGKDTFGVVLLNDRHLLLYADGRLFPIPAGTLYRIDGRHPHGALPVRAQKGRIGRFAALIWDMPSRTTLDEFRAEVLERLDALSKQ